MRWKLQKVVTQLCVKKTALDVVYEPPKRYEDNCLVCLVYTFEFYHVALKWDTHFVPISQNVCQSESF